jgi:hypothetical protein
MKRLAGDSRGAVFVEKLIVTIPVLLTFFLGWELAEVGAASLVVQRASAAAGRAAMVVLPDDPAYYAGEPPDSYSGARRADVELAAGMVLSAIPKLSDDFEVDVTQPPHGFGKIDVTVRAPYECGSVGLICGLGERLALSATTTHAYHGAQYEYTTPAAADTVVGSTAQALTGQMRSDDGPIEVGLATQGLNGSGFQCGADNALNAYLGENKNDGVHLGTQRTNSKYGDGTSAEAVKYRCAQAANKKDVGAGNLAVIKYKCGNVTDFVVAPSNSNTNSHSEPEVYKKYVARKNQLQENADCQIEEFYSEREPCDDGANCSSWFSTQFAKDEGLSPSEIGNLISFDFSYNPKREVDVPSDPYYASKKKACTQVRADIKKQAKQCGGGDPGKTTSCKQVEQLAQAYGLRSSKVSDCLEFLQAKEDFARRGPRAEFEKDTKKKLRDASKDCSGVDFKKYLND